MILFLFLIMAIVVRPAETEAASISLKAALEPSQNQYLASQGYYDVTRFYFSTDDKSLCNSTNCMYQVENGQLQPNIFTHGFTLVGDLKVSVPITQGIESRFYHMSIGLDKIGSIEYHNGTTFYMLGGTAGIGGAAFAPAQFSYNIQNATLLSVNNESRGIVVKAIGGNESAKSGTNTKTTNASIAKSNNGTQLQAFNDSPFGKAVIQGLGTRLGAKITYNATKQNNDVCFIHGVGMGKAADYYLNRAKQSLQHQIDIHNVTQAKITQAQKAFTKAETSFCKQ